MKGNLFIYVCAAVIALLVAGAALYTFKLNEEPFSLASAEDFAPSKYEERILELERQGIEEAFKNHLTNLYSVWMKDDRGQPDRAITGAQQARKAFIASMAAIEKREQQLKQLRELQH